MPKKNLPAGPASKKPGVAASRGPARPAEVQLTVDRALKKRWDGLLDAVKDARREGASAFDRLWEMVADIVEHDPPLYLAGGFATDKAFYSTVLQETERSARRNIRVAKYASPAEEVHYGTSKLDAVLGYLEAKSGGAQKGRLPVDFAKLRVPITRGGKTVTLALDEATVEEIAAATRALRRREGNAPVKTSPVVTAVSRALRTGDLRGISVRVAGGKLSLGDIPLSAVASLARALARVKLPDGDG